MHVYIYTFHNEQINPKSALCDEHNDRKDGIVLLLFDTVIQYYNVLFSENVLSYRLRLLVKNDICFNTNKQIYNSN
jgi:hypothetical protein